MTDANSRAQAIDHTGSYIVSAPAGSGKTSLLVQRYMRLLTTVQNPASVIAITFTRKAAAEMRERILSILNEPNPVNNSEHAAVNIKLRAQLLAHQTKLNWNIEKNPNQLKIMTIDALNNLISKQAPLLSTLGAQQSINPLPQADYNLAIRNFLHSPRTDNKIQHALDKLMLHVDNKLEKLHGLLNIMLAQREQWLPYIYNSDHKQQRKALESSLQTFNQAAVNKLLKHRPAKLDATLNELLLYSQRNLATQDSILLTENNALPDDNLKYLQQHKNLADLLLTKDGSWRKSITKNQGFPTKHPDCSTQECKTYKSKMLDYLEQANSSQYQQALQQIRACPPLHYEDNAWQILENLFTLLPELIAHLRVVFMQQQRTDYTERSLSAIYALAESQKDFSIQQDAELQHILIDEFQDTSTAQFRLLKFLTQDWQTGDRKTLFCVGDPMQSIYKFRQADVKIFKQVQQHGLGNIKLKHLQLTQNFRSDPELVSWINSNLESAFAKLADQDGSVKFSKAESPLPHNKLFQTSFVACSDQETEADLICNQISTIRAKSSGKIAILVRNRSHLQNIIPKLQQNNINFSSSALTPLAMHPHINDILSLTRVILHLDDKIAWLALLRSPYIGLKLSDIFSISKINPIANILVKPPSNISADGTLRLQPLLEIINNAIANSCEMPQVESIKLAWQDLSSISEAQYDTALNTYFKYLSDWINNSSTMDSCELIQLIASSYIDNISDAADAIDIMTIHHSKGLEFEHVIIPGLAKPSRIDEHKLLYWHEILDSKQQPKLMLAPISSNPHKLDPIYKCLRTIDQQQTTAEGTRLLYVALTRAKLSIHMYACLDTDREQSIKAPSKRSLLHWLWPQLKATLNPKLESTTTSDKHEPQQVIQQACLLRTDTAKSPRIYKTRAVTASCHNNRQARRLGNMVHEQLQNLKPTDKAFWLNESNPSRQQILTLGCRKHGVPQAQTAQMVDNIVLAMQNTLTDPRGQWIFSDQHRSIVTEYEINCWREDMAQCFIIDRAFTTTTDELWIIDFKTAIPDEGTNLQSFLQAQKQIYQAKMEIYAELMPKQPQQQVFCGLYFPLCSSWISWQAINNEAESCQTKNESAKI